MAIKGNLIEDIFKINLEFYNYEKKFKDKDYKCLNGDEDLNNYIVNPKWLNDLKKYICYDKFKTEISKYNMEITDLTKNKNIKEQIKSMIAPNIKTNFPDNLKDENYINAKKDSFYIREGKKNKKDYYSNFNVLKSSEFNALYNVINRKKRKLIFKNVIFQNNNTEKIILEIYNNKYGLCHFDKNNNYYICDFIFYFYEGKKGEYLEKLLIYKTLNDFFINEKFEKKEEKDDYINIMKTGKKGKIIFINKNFNHIDIFNLSTFNSGLYSKLFDDFFKNKKMKKLNEFSKKFLLVTKLYKDIAILNLFKLNLGFEKEKENQEINQKLKDKDKELEDQKELENQKDLEFQIEKAKLEEEIQSLRQNIQQGNQKENELIQKIQNIESEKEKINQKYLAENKNLKDIIENLKQNNQNINQQNIQKENQYKEEIKKLNDEIKKLKDEINKSRQPIPPGPSKPPKTSIINVIKFCRNTKKRIS